MRIGTARRRSLVVGLSLMVAATASVAVGAPAYAAVGVYPGMSIQRANGSTCSLGFLATSDKGRRLGVTAGHCSTDIRQLFYSAGGTEIGEVVARWDDAEDSDAYFGYTIIALNDNTTYTSNAMFQKFRSPEVGEWMWKDGGRSEETRGKITSVYYKHSDEAPQTSTMYSNIVVLPGDSGSPWYTTNDDGELVLLGITVGNRTRDDGSYVGAYGFPIYSMIRYIKKKTSIWGPGFTVVGR
ncbi:S1 family peptidase [Mycolicibacterium fortuitum]|uniref:S1 family peptidase n=1 Tax=Mycolicibacterium fortuitum TaxID=1766 RepID=UPI001C2B995B|nr:S1 family peptidase [Mycolicibacterium fortuitum]